MLIYLKTFLNSFGTQAFLHMQIMNQTAYVIQSNRHDEITIHSHKTELAYIGKQ